MADQVNRYFADAASKLLGKEGIKVSPRQIRREYSLVVRGAVRNPSFDSQVNRFIILKEVYTNTEK